MIQAIQAVVATEGPIHITVLYERLRNAWNIGRIGSRIRGNVDMAIMSAGVLRDGDFLTAPGPMSAEVRTPTPACRREIAQVHNFELALALVMLVQDAGGVSEDELTTRVARLYGWTRRGPDITARMRALIRTLRDKGDLSGSDDTLSPRQNR